MNDLDKIDRALLAALQTDGRMSNAKLAEAVGLSETPCARRLKRLESDGYLEMKDRTGHDTQDWAELLSMRSDLRDTVGHYDD